MVALNWQRANLPVVLRGPACATDARRRRGFPAARSTSTTTTGPTPDRSNRKFEAQQVVNQYYAAYNRRDIPELLDLFDEDVVYHDMAVYDEPFVGKDELAAYFEKIEKLVPGDIRFVVDDITGADKKKVGVIWHVELESDKEGFVALPFSRGCSFYELNDNGKIVYARDLVEPASKPGPAALGAISAIAPVIRKLGSKADPRNIRSKDGKDLFKAAGLYAFAATYVLVVLFSPIPPGSPGINVDPADLERILHESFNFFYVNIALSEIGLSPVPNIAENPVDEGIFNFVSAWSLTFLPLMANDPKGRSVGFKSKRNLWGGIMFLTNFFAPWYMARRLVPDRYTADPSKEIDETPKSLELGGSGTTIIAATSLAVGLFSAFWMLAGRPEFGSLEERSQFFVTMFRTNRVFWAFCLDALLYSVWQDWLLKDLGAKGWQRKLPFFGSVMFLLSGGSGRKADK